MGQEKGMETENPKAFVSATVVTLKSVLRGVLLQDSKFVLSALILVVDLLPSDS
jgi:hypothetical protein